METRSGAGAGTTTEQSIKALQDFYDLGTAETRAFGRRAPYAGTGTSSQKERRAKQRACVAVDTGWTKIEFQDLLRACREAKWAVSCTHLILLLGVPKKIRFGLQSATISKRWSTRQLKFAIHRHLGKRNLNAGRHRTVESISDAELQYITLADQWARARIDIPMALQDCYASTRKKGGRAPRFSIEVSVRLSRVDLAMGNLRRELEAELKRRRK
jgi:hypothetical protein